MSLYIDDIVNPTTMPLPSAEQYGMDYKTTGSGESVVCLGLRVYILSDIDGQRVVHTIVHDREAAQLPAPDAPDEVCARPPPSLA